MSIAALVLAGGNASRMGRADKPLLTVGGSPILARIIDAVRPDAAGVAISANGDPTRLAGYGLPVLPDGAFAGQGPLAGVLAGLDWASGMGAESLLTIPGDTPFVPIGLAAALAPSPACATSNGRTHHLIALWPVACADALRALLSAPGSRAVARFTDAIGMRHIAFPAGKWDPFLNVNTPDDLAVARSLAPRVEEGLP
jgi:molybdopterin-guanine dinucleotide biosynthesis protein A